MKKVIVISSIVSILSSETSIAKTEHFSYVDGVLWSGHQNIFYLRYDEKRNLVWAVPGAYVDSAKNSDQLKISFTSRNPYGLQYAKVPTRFSRGENLHFFSENEKIDLKKSTPIGNISNLTVNGQTNKWRYPTFREIKENNLFRYEQSSFIEDDIRGFDAVLGIKTQDSGVAAYVECSTNNRIRSGMESNLKKCNGKFKNGLVAGRRVDRITPIAVLVREANVYDKIIFSQKDPFSKLSELTTLLAKENLKVDPVVTKERLHHRVNKSLTVSNKNKLDLVEVIHQHEETNITLKLSGTCKSCRLDTSGSCSYKLNGNPFRYFTLKNQIHYQSSDNKKIPFHSGEVTFTFEKISGDRFDLIECENGKGWDFKNIKSGLSKVNFIPKPTTPNMQLPSKPEKGEFEKTLDFNYRLKEEKEKTERKNKKAIKEHQDNMMTYNHTINLAQRAFYDQVAFNNKPSTVKKITNKVVNQAINMVFGDPKFKNIKYNADKEVFNATLYSTLNNLSMNIEIKTPISKARELKEKLTDNRLVPQVYFQIEDNKLKFKRVEAIENKTRQNRDFSHAVSINSIESYKEFLELHPSSPHSKEAKDKIKKLAKKAEEISLMRQKETRARAKKYAENKTKERALYMKEKNVGDRVCKDGRVAFGLIGVTVSAYVEKVIDNSIQLRINSTEGQEIHYNSGRLYTDKILWDKHYEWKHCN